MFDFRTRRLPFWSFHRRKKIKHDTRISKEEAKRRLAAPPEPPRGRVLYEVTTCAVSTCGPVGCWGVGDSSAVIKTLKRLYGVTVFSSPF